MVYNQSKCYRMPADERHIASGLVHPCPAPVIIARAVQGCVEWSSRGLQVPSVVESATRSYQAQTPFLADFVAELCILQSIRTYYGCRSEIGRASCRERE